MQKKFLKILDFPEKILRIKKKIKKKIPLQNLTLASKYIFVLLKVERDWKQKNIVASKMWLQ